jgi:hypothetical protein
MHPVVIIEDMPETLENEQVLCSAKGLSTTVLTVNTQPVGNLGVIYLRSSRVSVDG